MKILITALVAIIVFPCCSTISFAAISPASISITPSCASVGTSVTISVTTSKSGAYLKYYVNETSYCTGGAGNWTLVKDWTTDTTATWTPSSNGRKTVTVRVTDDTSSRCVGMIGASYEVGSSKCIDPAGMRLSSASGNVNEAVTITATGSESDLYYRFYVNNNPYCSCSPDWELLRDWSTDNTFIWTPTTNVLYTLMVWTTDDTTNSCTGMGGMTYQVGGGSVDFPPCDDDSLGQLAQWETDLIESGSMPEAPAASFLTGEEGLALAYRDWVPDNWDGEGNILLFVHGSSAHSAEYSVVGEGLSRNGVYARFIDVRGHGLSICAAPGECTNPEQIAREYVDDNRYYPGRIGDAADTNQFIRDLQLHIQDLKGRWPFAAGVHLAGHSSGGGLIARYVQYNGMDSIDSAVLLAPFLHYQQRHADTGAKGVPRCACVEADYAQVQTESLVAALQGHIHRYVLHFNKEGPLLHPLDTLQNTYSAMTGMQVANINNYWHSFTKKTLWVTAELDILFDLTLAREELELYPGGGVFVTVRNTSHVGLIWSDAVAATLARWVTDPDSVSPGYIAP